MPKPDHVHAAIEIEIYSMPVFVVKGSRLPEPLLFARLNGDFQDQTKNVADGTPSASVSFTDGRFVEPDAYIILINAQFNFPFPMMIRLQTSIDKKL